MGHRCKVRITRLSHARTANAKDARENISKRAHDPSYRFAFLLFFPLSLLPPPLSTLVFTYLGLPRRLACFFLLTRQFSEPLKFAEACERFARNRVSSEFARTRGFELARADERDRERERRRDERQVSSCLAWTPRAFNYEFRCKSLEIRRESRGRQYRSFISTSIDVSIHRSRGRKNARLCVILDVSISSCISLASLKLARGARCA